MFNQSILSALQEITSFNQFAERNQVERMKVSDLKALCNETENLCEYIEYGLMELGDMISRLGFFAESEQTFDRHAMSNDNVKHIGALIQANAYFLNTLREASIQATYHLNGGDKGAK